MLLASEANHLAPGFNERLNQALGSEGGVQVYKDPEGNVGTILDPPGGERRHGAAAESPSMNLGPPPSATYPFISIDSGRASYSPFLQVFRRRLLNRMIYDGSSRSRAGRPRCARAVR
jgi:hypothetical protein